MYRGRRVLGQEICLGVLCVNGSRVPSEPTAAPTLSIYSDSARVVGGLTIPPADRYGSPGYFQRKVFLDGRFTTGQYRAVMRYTIGAYEGVAVDTFEIVPGGDAAGTPIAMYFYRRPNCDWVIQQTDAGTILKRRNPRL